MSDDIGLTRCQCGRSLITRPATKADHRATRWNSNAGPRGPSEAHSAAASRERRKQEAMDNADGEAA